MEKYFQNKAVLITGGGSGLGRALALEMARQGANIHILDINKDLAYETSRMIVREGGEARYFCADVANYESFSGIVRTIYETEERIDVLINNAGINITGEVRDMKIDHWNKSIRINLSGTVHGISLVYPGMVKQGSGQIVNIASMAGLAPIPLISSYVATKHAVAGLSRSLRWEAKALGVRVNLVCPGRLDTRIMETSEILGVDREKFMAKVPFAAMPLSSAVNKILTGMKRNKSIIVFPGYVRWLWLADRYMPFLLKPFYRYSLRKFRKLRKQES